jgi:PAS domain S-box-containing protein
MSHGATRILVVDDTPANRYAVSRTLRQDGFDVIEAERGFDAIELACAEQPELVVLDVNLPDIPGFEVVKRLRADPRTASVSIMHMSATFTDPGAHAQGLTGGADAYLIHPFDPRVLIATARALVRLRAAERRLAEMLERERSARAEAEASRHAAEQAERALRASEARFRRLSDSGLIGLVRWDLSGPILDANDAFLRMIGYTREDLEAGRLDTYAITPPEWHAATMAAVEHLRTHGKSEHIEKQYVRKDGSRVDVLVAGALLEGSQQALAITLDITKRRRAEHERGRLLGELETAIRARDEFLAIAMHDLRNPLNTLQLQLEVLLRRAQRGPAALAEVDGVAKLDSAWNQVQTLVRLLEDLLDVSRIGSGRLELQLEPIDLAEVARSACDRMRDQFAASGSQLKVTADAAVIGAWDRIRLEQVMNNLLSNALKYGAGQPVAVSVSIDAGRARLVVTDHGVGIEPANRERIFRQFERLHKGGDAKSFGLGLWIVQQIIESFGGRIWVDSALGEGSTFTVELPHARSSYERV